MKLLAPLLSAVILAPGTVAAITEEKAQKLVHDAIERLHSDRVADVWESFSETSRNEYRKAFLDHVAAIRDTHRPTKKINEPKWSALIKAEEDRRFGLNNHITDTAPWEGELRYYGFTGGLERTLKLHDADFWAVFIGEKFLIDKRNREFRKDSNPAVWPKTAIPVPTYRVEGVSQKGDRFHVILRSSHLAKRGIFSNLHFNRCLANVSWNIKTDNTPEVSFVWSGTIESCEPKLDVPGDVIDYLKLTTSAMREEAKKALDND